MLRSVRLALVTGTALAGALPSLAIAQAPATPVSGTAADRPAEEREILVTGSRIKRDPRDSALPLQIVTTQDLAREGISSPNS